MARRALALSLLLAVPAVGDAPRLPRFSGWVVDSAGVLSPAARRELTALADRLDKEGTAQLAVVSVARPDLGDLTRPEYAVKLFEEWRLGHGKQKSDGLLILFVPGPPGKRGLKVEVGYGLEGVLPDGKVGALMDQHAGPNLKRGDYDGAALELAQALASALEGSGTISLPRDLPAISGCVTEVASWPPIEGAFRSAIEAACARVEQGGRARMAVVLMRAEAMPGPVRATAEGMLESWGRAGRQKPEDRVVLLFTTSDDRQDLRKAELAVAPGLRDVIPRGLARSLIEKHARPTLWNGEYERAALSLAEAVAAAILGQRTPAAPARVDTVPAADVPVAEQATAPAAATAEVVPRAARPWSLSNRAAVAALAGTGVLIVLLVVGYTRKRSPGWALTIVGGATVACAAIGFTSGGVFLLFPVLPVVLFYVFDLRKHRCPKDRGWLRIETRTTRQPTAHSEGVETTIRRCTSDGCGFHDERTSKLPRTTPASATSRGSSSSSRDRGPSSSSSSSSFGGGGGGQSGGGGADREY